MDSVGVLVEVQAELERVVWSHMTTEDYYVRVTLPGRAKPTHMGIVSAPYPGETQWSWVGQDERRHRNSTREAAVRALVRHRLKGAWSWITS